MKRKETTSNKGRLRENIEAIVVALILALFIRTFIVQAFKIPSGSMLQTLQIGDYILVNKFIYGVKIPFSGKTLIPISEPEHGDIIVFEYPEDPSKDFIKRVVGLPGDTIEIRNKKVYVNGRWLGHPSYVQITDPNTYGKNITSRDNMDRIVVPEDSIFVMGDNRDNSHDSRFWGFVDFKSVKGKAFIIYWSWDSENFGVRWDRLADLLH